MKKIGFVFFAIGLGAIIYILLQTFLEDSTIVSPTPESDGIRVIYITPKSDK